MDVERTIEFLLAQQARADARQEQADIRLARIDRRVEAIAKLVQQGMKMLVKSSQEQRQTQKKADARMDRLETTVDRFIAALREHRGNGRK